MRKMATGHYARVEWDAGSGRWLLRRAEDAAKDQSYVLYSLTQAQLSRVLLPMGGMTKDAAREKAGRWASPWRTSTTVRISASFPTEITCDS